MVWPWQRHRDGRRLKRLPKGSTVRRNPGLTPGTPDPALGAESPVPLSDERSVPLSDERFRAGLRTIPTGKSSATRAWPTDVISGTSPDGKPLDVSLAHHSLTLVCFLSTQCDGCDAFWSELREASPVGLPADVGCIVVTRNEPSVDRDEVARLSEGIRRPPVVMSDEAWAAFQVFAYPFFVLVDGRSRSIVSESVGFGWPDVLRMVQPPTHE